MSKNLKKDMENLKDPVKSSFLQRYFKTGKGQYGEGDIFLGIKVPEQRKVAKRYIGLDFKSLESLLYSKIHEYRMVSLMILVLKYKHASEKDKKYIFDFYLKNIKQINNWDLVDVTAPYIIGNFLSDKDKSVLYKLSRSNNVWERRIAIVSTYAFIKESLFEHTLRISGLLLKDKHDLIHKATGWMLREIGKKNQVVLEGFLRIYHKEMPRTMLRYSIEKLDKKKREFYLKSKYVNATKNPDL